MADFFSREELWGGRTARQASIILFAIKSRTAYLVAQSRQAAARFVPPESAFSFTLPIAQTNAETEDLTRPEEVVGL